MTKLHESFCRQRETERGFTLLEVLVSIAVIAILLSLIVPAIQLSRESARRTQCINHLKQFGVAISGYESTFRFLPGSREDNRTIGGRFVIPPQVVMLGFLEKQSTLRMIEESPVFSAVSLDMQPEISFLTCPSDSIEARINYRMCTGASSYLLEAPTDGGPTGAGGAFAWRSKDAPVTMASITDGLSNTAAMSERLGSDFGSRGFDKQRDMWLTGASGSARVYHDAERCLALCSSLQQDPGRFVFRYSGAFYLDASYSSSYYNHVLPPNSPIADCSLNTVGDADLAGANPEMRSNIGATKANSLHQGGAVNVLFLDGGVRTVSSTVDLATWRAAATRDSGEIQ